MAFAVEKEFEEALIRLLSRNGWEEEVLESPSEEDLLHNWAQILFENNCTVDRLNGVPLTDGEMGQILSQIKQLQTPLKLNGMINGRTVSVVRDAPEDGAHRGKTVSLKIYDRLEIAAGQSRYQIARQPRFASKSSMLGDRRGDLMLLINGMPVIHIELKRSGVPVRQAADQIAKYAHEGVFSGLLSLVQIFVAMNPEETLYFANPGPGCAFNHDYFFHWADFNNEPINDWKQVVSTLLSIPMAHQLIGFYTVADEGDGTLKVMRSYQYYAANGISDRVAKIHWDERGHQRGGYVWHTTGSGKTMTSFKAAQLIADSDDADKVVFLTDRIELGTQSLKAYHGFAGDRCDVQGTEDTATLVRKLKSGNPDDTLIVTSIQKMSRIQTDEHGMNRRDVEEIARKRLVIIVDEAHRSTFGNMLSVIKTTFPNAVFFGFTGTPIQRENNKKQGTTATIFGNELHRYSIADGIRDGNVLGFDVHKVLTFRDADLRREVALKQAHAATEKEALADPEKAAVYRRFMDPEQVRMVGEKDADGNVTKGIDDFVPAAQYEQEDHRRMVVNDIAVHFTMLSRQGRFHALLATASINEAIAYYRLLKAETPELNVTALFDPNIDNNAGFAFKEDGLVEIMTDYNARYGRNYTLPTHAAFKKDIALRLAHKEIYRGMKPASPERIDLLIVVDQMLTGFDSKWVNTLYLDKLPEYENIIQAFSRTNRLYGRSKPFGVIRYYRRPHLMEQRIKQAVALYSGDRPMGLFVQKLAENIHKLNETLQELSDLFANAGIADFASLPGDPAEQAVFAAKFRELNVTLDAARVQGLSLEQSEYRFTDDGELSPDGETSEGDTVVVSRIDRGQLQALTLRYRELSVLTQKAEPAKNQVLPDIDAPFEIDGYLRELDAQSINYEYMNSRFDKYLKVLRYDKALQSDLDAALENLSKTFARLTQEEQKFAKLFLHDVQSGDVVPEAGKTFRDYITDYMKAAKDDAIYRMSEAFGMDEARFREMKTLNLNESTLNDFGHFDELKETVQWEKVAQYVEERTGRKLNKFTANRYADSALRRAILNGDMGDFEYTD